MSEPETANRKVWILASDEVLDELRAGWSRPVQLTARENPDGSWEMTIRAFYNRDGSSAEPLWGALRDCTDCAMRRQSPFAQPPADYVPHPEFDERGLGGGTPWWLGLIIVLGFGAIVLFLGVHMTQVELGK